MDLIGLVLAQLPPRFWGFLLFSSFVLAIALLMLAMHARSWHSTSKMRLSQDDYDFAWRRYRRRMQTSGMLVSLAVFLFLGQFIEASVLALFYWFGVLMMIVWVIGLATLDLVASRRHYSRLVHDNRIKQAQLKAKLDDLSSHDRRA